MNDRANLHRRLTHLGLHKTSPAPQAPRPSAVQAVLPPGQEIPTPHGTAFRILTHYPGEHHHGLSQLSDVLGFPASLAAEIGGNRALGDRPLEHLVYLDTETTGLAGGAGTLVFIVGIGTFDEGAFRMRQYFLRDPAEEAAMLHALEEDLTGRGGFVTFNGQAFDLPLLDMRFRIGLRKSWAWSSQPNLDLLAPSRRLWRRTLPDCTLGTIERNVLGVVRTDEDVPGAWIPEMYLHYLRTGETGEMARVLYHNAIDVLSLVGLTTQILERHGRRDPAGLQGGEALAVARWHQAAGRASTAEDAYRTAVARSESGTRVDALRHYSQHLRRAGRAAEAVDLWQDWHALDPADPAPCLELAKYYEWQRRDLLAARAWANEGLLCLTHWPADWRRKDAWEAIMHRLDRLARKASD
jgi:uncharacterized protein YprB with RNaseH-like and TPR domain